MLWRLGRKFRYPTDESIQAALDAIEKSEKDIDILKDKGLSEKMMHPQFVLAASGEAVTRHFLHPDEVRQYKATADFNMLLENTANGVHIRIEQHPARRREILAHACIDAFDDYVDVVYDVSGVEAVDLASLVNMVYTDLQIYIVNNRNEFCQSLQ